MITTPRPGGGSAYFFLGRDAEGNFKGYPHLAVLVAEGLRSLGWSIASDVRTWKPSLNEEELFPGEHFQPRESDLIVVGDDYFINQRSPVLPPVLDQISVPAIYLDRSDLNNTAAYALLPSFRRFAAIYRTHANRVFAYPSNVKPIVFGITDRIARACYEATSSKARSGALWNFRHTKFPHTVRLWVERHIRPELQAAVGMASEIDSGPENNAHARLMCEQTENRHFSSYFSRMKGAMMVSCFGGWFLLPVSQTEAGSLCMFGRRLFRSLPVSTSRVAQWDSWRLWETFGSGAVVLHLDFDHFGFLPGGPLPEAGRHYVAFGRKDLKRELVPLLRDEAAMREIGEAGRVWAFEHYSSKPIAARILNDLGLRPM